MNLFRSLKKKIINIYKIIKYAYIVDLKIKGKKIKYGTNKKQCYKVYNTSCLNTPTIFFVHGGGWWQGSPSLYSGIGKFFLKNGYTTSLVGYRLVPRFTYPTQIDDAFLALRHYIDNNQNCTSIILAGYSAGSEIASRLTFDSERQKKYKINKEIIKGFVSISGVLDFEKCYSKYSKKLIKNYLRNQNLEYANPVNVIDSKSVIPTLCVHGDKDRLISINNSISFVNKLRIYNDKVELIVIKGADHEHTIDIIRGKGNIYTNHIFKFINDNK